jgi:hypothetical protein
MSRLSQKLQPENEDQEKLSDTVIRIGEGIRLLRSGSGYNMRAITILLARETGIAERNIKKVLDGINELHKHYFDAEQ